MLEEQVAQEGSQSIISKIILFWIEKREIFSPSQILVTVFAKVPSGHTGMHVVPDKYRIPEQLVQLEAMFEVQVAQLSSQVIQ